MPDLKLHYSDSGASGKPALIFLHGFPFNHTMWDEQEKLCRSNFRVVTYDHRGHGQSDLGSGSYMFEFFIDDLLRLMDELEIERAVLCGLSMGGYVALRAFERRPERVKGLILCDTRSEADTDAGKIKRAADLRFIQEQGLDVFAEKFTKNVLAPGNLENSELFDRVRQMIRGNPTKGVQATLVALATRTDTTACLNRIQVPTLILVGADDAITPPAVASAMHERIPHSKMAIIPRASHLSNLDNPAAFNASLMEFLAQIRA